MNDITIIWIFLPILLSTKADVLPSQNIGPLFLELIHLWIASSIQYVGGENEFGIFVNKSEGSNNMHNNNLKSCG